MSTNVISGCELHFNAKATAALPAKIDPEAQMVVFSRSNELSDQIFSRAALYRFMRLPEAGNLEKFGLSDLELANGWSGSDYSILRPVGHPLRPDNDNLALDHDLVV